MIFETNDEQIAYGLLTDAVEHNVGVRVAVEAFLAAAQVNDHVIDFGGDGHVVDFGDDGWAIQHPLRCRPNMLDCDVHRRFAEWMAVTDGPPVEPGRYWLSEETSGGKLRRWQFEKWRTN